MKKLLLLSAVVLGAASVSQAGVRLNIGFNLPLPAPPVAVFSRPAAVCAPAPLVTAPVCEPAPVVLDPQVCEQPLAIAPPVVIRSRSILARHPVYERHNSHDSRRYPSAHWDHYRGR